MSSTSTKVFELFKHQQASLRSNSTKPFYPELHSSPYLRLSHLTKYSFGKYSGILRPTKGLINSEEF